MLTDDQLAAFDRLDALPSSYTRPIADRDTWLSSCNGESSPTLPPSERRRQSSTIAVATKAVAKVPPLVKSTSHVSSLRRPSSDRTTTRSASRSPLSFLNRNSISCVPSSCSSSSANGTKGQDDAAPPLPSSRGMLLPPPPPHSKEKALRSVFAAVPADPLVGINVLSLRSTSTPTRPQPKYVPIAAQRRPSASPSSATRSKGRASPLPPTTTIDDPSSIPPSCCAENTATAKKVNAVSLSPPEVLFVSPITPCRMTGRRRYADEDLTDESPSVVILSMFEKNDDDDEEIIVMDYDNHVEPDFIEGQLEQHRKERANHHHPLAASSARSVCSPDCETAAVVNDAADDDLMHNSPLCSSSPHSPPCLNDDGCPPPPSTAVVGNDSTMLLLSASFASAMMIEEHYEAPNIAPMAEHQYNVDGGSPSLDPHRNERDSQAAMASTTTTVYDASLNLVDETASSVAQQMTTTSMEQPSPPRRTDETLPVTNMTTVEFSVMEEEEADEVDRSKRKTAGDGIPLTKQGKGGALAEHQAPPTLICATRSTKKEAEGSETLRSNDLIDEKKGKSTSKSCCTVM